MSRIAKQPVVVPGEVQVKLSPSQAAFKGNKGEICVRLHPNVSVEQGEGQLLVRQAGGGKKGGAMSGTIRSLLANAVHGVAHGFEKRLIIEGIGYRAKVAGTAIDFTLGFSHPLTYEPPEGIKISCPSPTELVITGVDKQKVGQVAADIRSFRPPEPYKEKGIRFSDEQPPRKEFSKK